MTLQRYLQYINSHRYIQTVDLIICGVALQCSSGRETAYDVKFTTPTPGSKDRSEIHCDSEVKLHFKPVV